MIDQFLSFAPLCKAWKDSEVSRLCVSRQTGHLGDLKPDSCLTVLLLNLTLFKDRFYRIFALCVAQPLSVSDLFTADLAST